MGVSLSCFWHIVNTQQPPKDGGNQNKSVLYIFFPWPMHFEGGYKGTFDYLQLQIRVKYKVGCIFMLITE